ncbi:hypothetical protein [Metamycoplasma hyosynoviae]|uniref:hypothetical protein n=1 Tax=Metamycoplasma hyosynoviae TaxID=29559 RepID=UPI002358C41B|nr:hypothetical protein [Metamycoplasma hyosynoviae]MDC8914367.1 hypothetical protein [Metamycoplasma hyosynoviae]
MISLFIHQRTFNVWDLKKSACWGLYNNKKLEEDYGLLDKITNKNFIDAIESATVTISYYRDNEMERKYHTNDSNLINYENYKIFEKIISKISM